MKKIIKKYFFELKNFILNSIYRIENSKIINNKITKNIIFFLKQFKISIIFIIIVICFINIKNVYNHKFKYNNITSMVKKSKFIGNAILLRDDYFLTTYDNLIYTCSKYKIEDEIYYYAVSNNNVYKVNIYSHDIKNNLVLLKIDRSKDKYVTFTNKNFYTFLSYNHKIDYIGDRVYISKSLNSSYDYFFEKYNIKYISDYGFAVKSFDNIRNNFGEAVLNENLELIGITNGNTSNNKFTNKIEFIDLIKIKKFLIDSKVYYMDNRKNINLKKVNNYLKFMNAKIICYEHNKRIPLTIERSF